MRQLLTATALAVLVLVLVSTSPAQAGNGRGRPGGHGGGLPVHHAGKGGGHHGGHAQQRGHNVPKGGRYKQQDKHGKGYHLTHGKKFSKGYYYRGRNHHHWSHRHYNRGHRCNFYYCPSVGGWYYWCRARDSYLPVSCIEDDPPDAEDPEEEF
jgi:hypothetical protein